jgi:hypothetical protein
MEIDNVTLLTVQNDENVKRTSDEQQPIITEASVINESSPLLQRERPTYEEPFSGLASFFCCPRCQNCSIT